jgi:hypothetical protein
MGSVGDGEREEGAHASLQHDGVEFLLENAATAPNMSGFCPSTCLLSYPPLSLIGYYIYYILYRPDLGLDEKGFRGG